MAFAKSPVGSVVCFGVAGLASWLLASHLLITTTPSLSERVFWKTSDRAKIESVQRGDFVIFDQFLPEPKQEVRSLIKRVACGPGDTLTVTGDSYFCNGQYLGLAKHKTRMGSPLTPFVFNGVIPPGNLFAMGDHKDSYDSRYWGFKEISKINARAWAFF